MGLLFGAGASGTRVFLNSGDECAGIVGRAGVHLWPVVKGMGHHSIVIDQQSFDGLQQFRRSQDEAFDIFLLTCVVVVFVEEYGDVKLVNDDPTVGVFDGVAIVFALSPRARVTHAFLNAEATISSTVLLAVRPILAAWERISASDM
jgi:hypothetical protein